MLLGVGLTSPGGAASAAASRQAAASAGGTEQQAAGPRHPANIDVREASGSTQVAARARRLALTPQRGVERLQQRLGVQSVVQIDPLTGTPRSVSKLDGYLTRASSRPAAAVVLRYVRSHRSVFRLSRADLRTLRLRSVTSDSAGVRHLSWVQYAGRVPVFGNGLKANVSRTGRLISVQGSPVHQVGRVGAAPRLSPQGARSAAIRDVGATPAAAPATTGRTATRSTRFRGGDQARLVAFQTVAGTRLAWQTLTRPASDQMYLHVVDASSGAVLYRHDLVQNDNAVSADKKRSKRQTGLVWDYWPGSPRGGRQRAVDLNDNGWLPRNSPRLAGNNAHVFSDTNDDNVAQPTEEVTPAGAGTFRFGFQDFTGQFGAPCSTRYQCSWLSAKGPTSWQTNRKQNAVQVFYYVNLFHDHLRAAPIGFTRSAGNFEAVDGDALQAQPDDGAATDPTTGGPDSNHVDNANMGTPPDGTSPTMQMYLFRDPADPEDPFAPTNGGDEADVVYHEYTHGLSNRLVVDNNGVSTLTGIQAGSMGEAWSDWYAMDFLNDEGFQPDSRADGDVRIGDYVGVGQDLIRTQPMDCSVGSTSAKCPGTATAGSGGYTYGDFGTIIGTPEVHADGEIWGETLWDLRTALGSRVTESLLTRAMQLSPANPSFLDERNAILQADTVTRRGRDLDRIWSVFAKRGMGYFAGTATGDDTSPAEDFSRPPSPRTPKGSITGTVTDSDSHTPVGGVTVAFGGHDSGFPGDYATTTAGNGSYTISGIFAGTYPKVYAAGAGYDPQVQTVSVRSGTTTVNWSLRRDWAASSGGADITGTDDTGAPFGCGVDALIDQSQGVGWSAERVVTGGVVTPVVATVTLPRPVDVSEITVDPSNTCGDGGSASTGPYQLEVSSDGTAWTTVSQGTFTANDQGRFASFKPAGVTGVRYVRYTMKDSQVSQLGTCPGGFSGCDFIDSSELEVYGAPSP